MNSQIIHILENHGVKPTAMRMLVLEQLLTQNRHLSLSDLEELLHPADRVTIYRTLQTFVKNGIAHSVEAPNSASVYGLCSDNCNNHSHADLYPHFICEKCYKVTCSDDFSYTIHKKSDSPLYEVHKIEVNIKGICPDCISM